MKLEHLLNDVEYCLIKGNFDVEVKNIAYHSKQVTKDSIFFAIKGHRDDGAKYMLEAADKGAAVIVIQAGDDIPSEVIERDVVLVEVENVRKSLARISSNFYGRPSEKMLVIGVTGTKGKTSVTYMIRHILQEAGIKTGLIGTVQSGFDGNWLDSDSTTPQSVDIQKYLFEMFLGECKAVVMEVSSQGLMQDRIEAIDFDIGVFTNISPDHIGDGEHGSFEEYLFWKSRLFRLCSRAVVNIDDSFWEDILKDNNPDQTLFFGRDEKADFIAKDIELWRKGHVLGSKYTLFSKEPCGDDKERLVELAMPGEFNIYNSLAAVTTTRALGIPWHIIFEGLKSVKIPGRVETVDIGSDFTVMIDYAHNGVALTNLLESLKRYEPGRIVLVFGCGGNRDRNRRFEMGGVAQKLADYIIVTSDNPRFENPEDIIADITSVMDLNDKKTVTIPDRKKAIEMAIKIAQEGDIIVIAGKGHEKYQIIDGNVSHFDDKEVVLSIGKEPK